MKGTDEWWRLNFSSFRVILSNRRNVVFSFCSPRDSNERLKEKKQSNFKRTKLERKPQDTIFDRKRNSCASWRNKRQHNVHFAAEKTKRNEIRRIQYELS